MLPREILTAVRQLECEFGEGNGLAIPRDRLLESYYQRAAWEERHSVSSRYSRDEMRRDYSRWKAF